MNRNRKKPAPQTRNYFLGLAIAWTVIAVSNTLLFIDWLGLYQELALPRVRLYLAVLTVLLQLFIAISNWRSWFCYDKKYATDLEDNLGGNNHE